MLAVAVSGLFSGGALHAQVNANAEAERDARWAARDTPAARAAFAADFSARLNLGPDYVHTGLRGRAPLRPIAESIQAGRHEEAMKAFADYYYIKLLDPAGHGLDAADVSPYTQGVAGHGRWPSAVWGPVGSSEGLVKQAEAFLSGTIEIGGKPFSVVPGKVNWNHPLPYGASVDPKNPNIVPDPTIASGAFLNTLVRAYAVTGNAKYHKLWVDLMDDWSLNAFPLQSQHPLFITATSQNALATTGVRLVKTIAELRRIMPPEQAPLPPRVLAQVLSRAFGDFPLSAVVYLRSNTHNWTPGSAVMLTALLGDEFRTSPFYFRENKRRSIEDNAVTQNLRDGTENQQCPWYNHNYTNTVQALRLMQARSRQEQWREVQWVREANHDARWMDEIREHLQAHATYMIHLRTPQNEWPTPYRGGDKRQADGSSRYVSPEAFTDPVNLAVLGAVAGDPTAKPPYHSEWFPYAGYSIMRDGWGPLDGYGAMFASPRPGAYGGFRSRSNNNVFSVSAAGQDLLVDDTTGHYMYPTSPVRVDGRDQDFHAGERVFRVTGPAGHKSYLQRAWTEPADWRWHASDHFNVQEGIYQGPYIKNSVRVDDVAHQRIAQQVRGTGLWIVTDRMATTSEHSFEQRWMFPVEGGATFGKTDFVIDEAAQLISTESKAEVALSTGQKVPKANVTLYQVGTQLLGYTSKLVPRDPKNRYMAYGRNEVTASWKTGKPSQVVTLIQSRTDGAGRVKNFTPRRLPGAGDKPGVVGFAATAADGREVFYLSADHGAAPLTLRGIETEAQSLLLAGDRGIVLGARSLRVGGVAAELPGADFEFALAGGKLAAMTPIYRPIDPVVIGPAQTSFVDSVDVTFASRTPGVEIRYTLDGTEPTPRSDLYNGPVRITRTTVVKARAYRVGVTANPVTTDGTHATAVSSAYFKAEQFNEPTPNVRGNPGVRFSYRQDTWTNLLVHTDQVKATATAVVPNLFDLSKIPNSNPALGTQPAPRKQHYAVRYEGFLDIPEDGVYTFHAPEEYVYPDIEAGYDLRLWLGNRTGKVGNSIRVIGTHEWYPSTRLHAFGSWSIALKKGMHPFKLEFVDYRTDAATWLNRPGLRDYIWTGSTPDLLVSGPGLDRQPIPQAWLKY